jgi:hypothetical protein
VFWLQLFLRCWWETVFIWYNLFVPFWCVSWRETKIWVLTKTHALLHLECLDGCNSGGKFIWDARFECIY